MKKITVYLGLLCLAVIAFTLTAKAQQTGSGSTFLSVNEDSSFSPVRSFIIYKNGPLYNVTMAGEKVLDLTVDGRKIPADSFYVYDPVIKRIAEQIKKDRIQAKLDMEQAGRDKLQAERDAVQAQRDKLQAERDAEQMQKDKVQAEKDAVQVQKDKLQAEGDHEQARKDKKQAEEDRAILKSVISAVVKDGLAPDEKSVTSLYLDENEFVVNGKSQPEDVRKKYTKKFVVRQGFIVSYRHNR